MTRKVLIPYIGPAILLLLVAGSIVHFFDNMHIEPAVTAWGLAAVNHAAALWSLTLAQRVETIPSMLLVFGGGGVRMLLMIGTVIAVLVVKAEWMLSFCVVLLMCFVAFLIIEIVVIHRRGFLQHQSSEV